MNNSKILGMSQMTFAVVLSISGGLLMVLASSLISVTPPGMLMPVDIVVADHKWIVFYRVLQVIGAVAAIVGVVKAYKNFKS